MKPARCRGPAGRLSCFWDEYLKRLVEQDQQPFRLFVGYAGWAGGQLESELEVGGWLTTPATCDDVFSEADDLCAHR